MTTKLWIPQLGKIRLPTSVACQDAVAELSKISGIPRQPRLSWLGRNIGLFYKGVCFVVTQTNHKPPTEKIVAWPIENHTLWLPSERNSDLVDLCQRIGESSDLGLVVWHDFVNMDYGVVRQQVLPRQVTELTSKDFNIDLRPHLKQVAHAPSNSSLWWQEWGGRLFLITIKRNRDDAIVEFNFNSLATGIGRFRKLPFRR
jgi:hypothetical protein